MIKVLIVDDDSARAPELRARVGRLLRPATVAARELRRVDT